MFRIAFVIASLVFMATPPVAHAQNEKPIKRGANCKCAKELYGIERVNGRCSWNKFQADAIMACAAKK